MWHYAEDHFISYGNHTGSKIQIANYLCPGNYAVSGSLQAAKVLEEIAKPDFGARMTVSSV